MSILKRSGSYPFILPVILLLFQTCSSFGDLPVGTPSKPRNIENNEFTINKDDIVWEQTNGPEGGDCHFLALDRTNPDQMVTGNMNSIFYSSNGGNSWEKVMNEVNVCDIESAGSSPGVVYLAGYALPGYRSTIWRSEDGGKSWTEIYSKDDIHMISGIETAPENDQIIYASVSYPARLLKSINGGKSWKQIASFDTDNITAVGVVREGVIVLGAGGGLPTGKPGSLLVSRNDGRSWETPELGQPKTSFVSSILISPDNPERIYTGFGDSYNRQLMNLSGNFAFTSGDGGKTWIPVTDDQHTDAMINYLTCSGSEGSTVYAAYGGALKKSSDGGLSWTNLIGHDVFSAEAMKISPMDFVDLEIHPDNPDILYLPLGGAGIAKSTDGGETWNHINSGLIGMSVGNMAVHPDNPETLYAGGLPTGIPGTFRTRDRGNTWEKLDGNGIYHSFTDEIYVHPTSPDRVFNIADVGTMFESDDGGNTWHSVFDPQHGSYNPRPPETPFRFSSVYALAVDPKNSETVYAVKNGFGAFKSVSGGSRWEYQIFSPDYSYCIVPDPETEGILYSGYQKKVFDTDSALYRNRIDSEEWDILLSVPGARAVRWVEIDPSDPKRIYAGIIGERGAVYVTKDRGRGWEILNDQLTFTTIWGHSQLQVHPEDPETVFAGTWGGGSYRTSDGGETWVKLDDDHLFSPPCLAICDTDPNIVYACDRTAPLVHRSDDGGDTWRVYYDFRKDFGGEYFMTSALAIDPHDPDVIIVSAFRYPVAIAGKLVRVDKSGLLDDLSNGLPRSVVEIEIDDKNPDTMYVSTHVHGLFTTGDGGKTWKRLDGESKGLPVTGYYDIDIHPVNHRILFASSLSGALPSYMLKAAEAEKHLAETGSIRNIGESVRSGVYRSLDGGETWKLVLSTRSEARGVDISRENPDILAAADMTGGVWISSDGGNTWAQENDNLGSLSMTSVEIRGNRIYAGTQGSGVYSGILENHGSIKWLSDKSNKPVAEVRSIQIEVDQENHNRIYAAAYPGGVLRSDDGGKTWNDKNFLTPSIRVEDPDTEGYYSLALDPNHPEIVWLGVYGKGIFVSYDAMEYDSPANGTGNTMAGKHITKLVVNPVNSSEVWAACEEGVFVTKDAGKTWTTENKGFYTPGAFTLAFGSDGTLYAGTRGYGVYRFNRRDRAWVQCEPFGNFGRFWSTWDRPLYQFSDMLIDPENPDNWYLASFPTGLYRSTDAGKTWHESNVGFIEDGADGIFSISFKPDDPKTIIAGTYNGVSISTDGGNHWERKSEGIPEEQWPFSVAVDPTDPDIMYIATKNGKDKGFFERHRPPYDFRGVVMKTTDGGESWFTIMEGLQDDNEFYNIILHPKNRNILFVSTSFDGVYISTDAGASWQACNNGLENTRGAVANNVAMNLVLDCEGRYLYFGTMGSGVWRARLY